jgi:hypothetical protein
VAGHDFNGGLGNLEAFRYIFNAHLVGSIVYRRRCEFYLNGITMGAYDLIL